MTATREAGFTKNGAQDAGFFPCLSGISEIMTISIHVLAAKAIQQDECSIVSPIKTNYINSDLVNDCLKEAIKK